MSSSCGEAGLTFVPESAYSIGVYGTPKGLTVIGTTWQGGTRRPLSGVWEWCAGSGDVCGAGVSLRERAGGRCVWLPAVSQKAALSSQLQH